MTHADVCPLGATVCRVLERAAVVGCMPTHLTRYADAVWSVDWLGPRQKRIASMTVSGDRVRLTYRRRGQPSEQARSTLIEGTDHALDGAIVASQRWIAGED